jgi:hypothetical protein
MHMCFYLSLTLALFRNIRDGDVVKIRVSEDDKSLMIHDNHQPDASAVASDVETHVESDSLP